MLERVASDCGLRMHEVATSVAGIRKSVQKINRQTNPDIAHLNTLGALWHSPQDWNYYTTEQAGASGRRIHLPRGHLPDGNR